MRGTHHLPPRRPVVEAPAAGRKVFNCIVDDTALVAGVKLSTRDGIRKWVAQDAIRLFVPLQTLAQLNRISKGTERLHADARDAIVWLDKATEDQDLEGRVQIEGPDEHFAEWDEVEQFLLPETLLSIDDVLSDDDDESDFADDLEDSLAQLDVSDGTSMSSSHSLDDGPKTPHSQAEKTASAGKARLESNVRRDTLVTQSPDRSARGHADCARSRKLPRSADAVPSYLKPLFNHILWRIHRETNPEQALDDFILLTNDQAKQAIAQKFGIRTRRLEQLREAVAREDREFRNHQMLNKIESGELKPSATHDMAPAEKKAAERPKSSHSQNEPGSDDEDVVLFNRAPRGPQAQTAVTGHRVFDPNDFGRTNNNNNKNNTPVPTTSSNNLITARGGRGGVRGRGAFAGPARGRGGAAPRGRGPFVSRGAYTPPAQPFRSPPAPRPAPADPNGLLNPDSYERPAPRASTMRGGRRKLWEPN